MNNNFPQLKPGHLVDIERYERGMEPWNNPCIIKMYENELVVTDGAKYNPLQYYEEGKGPYDKISRVYGYSKRPNDIDIRSINYRDVIWEESKPKKMTVEEIERELGYRIEIVSGNYDCDRT